MKKLLMFLLIGILLSGTLSAEVIQIETSKGTQDFIKPEGMSDDDIIYMLASMYLEERFANDDLLLIKEQFEELSLSIDSYIEENKVLEERNDELIKSYEELGAVHAKLMSDYESLNGYYEELAKPKFIRGMLGAGMTISDKAQVGLRLSGGIIFIEDFAIELGLNLFPPVLNIGVSYLF